jgi:hypothetical protein
MSDGVVVDVAVFGWGESATQPGQQNLGRAVVHMAGHYLGLRYTLTLLTLLNLPTLPTL